MKMILKSFFIVSVMWLSSTCSSSVIREIPLEEALHRYATALTLLHRAVSPCPCKITIITSLYKGRKFIEDFIIDITRQTIFDACELLIIDAHSSEDEHAFIAPYLSVYDNIFYMRLEETLGLYTVWNMAIKLAQGEYLINANVDDRLAFNALELFAKELDDYPCVDLVYADYYLCPLPNKFFEECRGMDGVGLPEFSPKEMICCLPNNHPMWRKTFHDKYGLFDESFKITGDYELWLRAVSMGAQFKKIQKKLGLFYLNDQGLSRSLCTASVHRREINVLHGKYGYLWSC